MLSYILTFIAGGAVGAVIYALVIKKNPKIQADVTKAAGQVQSAATTAATDVKKL